MGLEFSNMDIVELEDLLYETSKYNDRDFSSFREALYDMYGGISSDDYPKLIHFLEKELGITSDSELTHIREHQKELILKFVSKLYH